MLALLRTCPMPTSDLSSTSLTRRKVLGIGGAGAIGGLACYLGWPSGGKLSPSFSSDVRQPALAAEAEMPESAESNARPADGMLRRNDFLPHLNSQFRLGSASETCKLIEVGAEQKITSPTAGFVSFSLLFAAPAGFVAESKIHALSHAKLGTLELFISPVGDSKERVYLEAVCCQRV